MLSLGAPWHMLPNFGSSKLHYRMKSVDRWYKYKYKYILVHLKIEDKMVMDSQKVKAYKQGDDHALLVQWPGWVNYGEEKDETKTPLRGFDNRLVEQGRCRPMPR